MISLSWDSSSKSLTILYISTHPKPDYRADFVQNWQSDLFCWFDICFYLKVSLQNSWPFCYEYLSEARLWVWLVSDILKLASPNIDIPWLMSPKTRYQHFLKSSLHPTHFRYFKARITQLTHLLTILELSRMALLTRPFELQSLRSHLTLDTYTFWSFNELANWELYLVVAKSLSEPSFKG